MMSKADDQKKQVNKTDALAEPGQEPKHEHEHDEHHHEGGCHCEVRIAELEAQLTAAQESELRAQADYRNLMRRTQEERARMMKLAAASTIESILQPLAHLKMATDHLKDPGLQMVYQQFQTALENEGLSEIDCMNKPFDGEIMEVIDTKPATGNQKPGTVIQIAQAGYKLNGDVIRHAKVIVAGEAA